MMLAVNVIIISLLFFRVPWAKGIVHPHWWPYLSIGFELITFLITRYYYWNGYFIIGNFNTFNFMVWLWTAWAVAYFIAMFVPTFLYVHDNAELDFILKKDWLFYHPSNLKKLDTYEYKLTMLNTHARLYLLLPWLWLLVIVGMKILLILYWRRWRK